MDQLAKDMKQIITIAEGLPIVERMDLLLAVGKASGHLQQDRPVVSVEPSKDLHEVSEPLGGALASHDVDRVNSE